MKSKFTYVLFFLCLMHIFSFQAKAQQDIKSGSLQVIGSSFDILDVEISGTQSFRERVSNNIIFSNLLPGEYLLTIYSSPVIGRKTLITNQTIVVDEGKRTIVRVSKQHPVIIQSVPDENSQWIFIDNRNAYRKEGRHRQQSYLQVMNDGEFNQFFKTVSKEAFDDKKLMIISSVAGISLFTTEQMSRIMKLFDFDNKRLACAKTMAPQVVDARNLYLLSNNFDFQSSKDEYFEFLKTFQPKIQAGY